MAIVALVFDKFCSLSIDTLLFPANEVWLVMLSRYFLLVQAILQGSCSDVLTNVSSRRVVRRYTGLPPDLVCLMMLSWSSDTGIEVYSYEDIAQQHRLKVVN